MIVSAAVHGALILLILWYEVQAVRWELATVGPAAVPPNVPIGVPVDTRTESTPEDVPENTSPGLTAAELNQLILTQFQNLLKEQTPRARADQQQQLEQLADRLDRQVRPESVDEITAKLAVPFVTAERATAPSNEAVGGDFDHSTAQVHDVRKLEDAAGRIHYVGVLVDSQGRSMEIELDEADGAELYRVFEIIHQHPLLEKVYRSVVMSLLDKMLQANQISSRPDVGNRPTVPPLAPSEEPAGPRQRPSL